ncbi:MAG: hypothetical protein JWP52_1821, partial [Rhizobacter sp.]|nr:hypothetical protein [Rhizobacter sp.]
MTTKPPGLTPRKTAAKKAVKPAKGAAVAAVRGESEKHEAGQAPASAGPVFGLEQLRALGSRLRQVRETRRWSLKRLATESGV